MAKILISIAACCLWLTSVFGQYTSDLQDVLFLKDGTRVKGYILETDSVQTKIVSFGDHIKIVKNEDIVHQEKQAPGKVTLFNERRFRSEGFQSQVETFLGYNNDNRHNGGVRFINGWKFNDRNFVGLGLGVSVLSDYYGNIQYSGFRSYPVFLRYSVDLWAKRSTPYAFIDIGTQLYTSNGLKLTKPGNVRLGIGNKIITKRAIFYTSLSYSYGKMRSYYSLNTSGYTDWYRNHNVELSIGFQFN